VQTSRHLRLGQRDLEVRLSRAAQAALAAGPLVVEMELYFSCLIRKRVLFPPAPHKDATCARLDEGLTVCFRPVMTRQCAVSGVQESPELETFPIQRPEAFLPKWLTLDLRNGNWSGEFGY
jgi:hypothetical protein